MSDLVILDLGYGNTRSIALAFERLEVSPRLSADPSVVEQAGRLVLPGVGAAGEAMRRLRDTGLTEILQNRSLPTLGICLGMQLMFEHSEENGGTPLLGLLPGNVEPIAPERGFPVPHMGWTALDSADAGIGVTAGDYVYFAHGFACPESPATAGRAHYGDTLIPAVLRKGPLWGAQFHPERSSRAGASFLKAFLQS